MLFQRTEHKSRTKSRERRFGKAKHDRQNRLLGKQEIREHIRTADTADDRDETEHGAKDRSGGGTEQNTPDRDRDEHKRERYRTDMNVTADQLQNDDERNKYSQLYHPERLFMGSAHKNTPSGTFTRCCRPGAPVQRIKF